MNSDVNELGLQEWEATMRVYNLAIEIGRNEGADLEILAPAALLHDLGKIYETREGTPHHIAGVARKVQLLQSAGYSEEEIKRIIDTISVHQKKLTPNAASLEGKVLQDADNVDEMGLVGLIRSAMWHSKKGDPIYLPESLDRHPRTKPEMHIASPSVLDHLYDKLLTLDNILNTKTGKRLGRQRIRTMSNLVATLKDEILAQDRSVGK